MDCKLCLTVLVVIACCGITNAKIEFPFCVWGLQWIYQPDSIHEPEVAWTACKAACLPMMTTHFGITRMVATDDMVHCVCGEFINLAHEPENCELYCGFQNKYLCGGPFEDPIYMNIYSVCDPYDFHGQNCQIPCPETCYVGCDRNTGQCIYGCDPGYWDIMCSTPCPANCVDGLCHDFGWCHECVDGYYGDFCEEACPQNCSAGLCDPDTGECYCDNGWCGQACNETCAIVDGQLPNSLAESEEETKQDCGLVIQTWAIVLIVSMSFIGGAAASVITYIVCVRWGKRRQQNEHKDAAIKSATKHQNQNDETGSVKNENRLYQDAAFDNDAYNAGPIFAI